MTTTAHWIELDGAANVRDVAGLPTSDGTTVRPGRLIRSDNLQGLTERDVRTLVDELDVRTVVDLRTGVEVRSEGPGPMTGEPEVVVRHLSLFPESGQNTDAAADGPVILPWVSRDASLTADERKRGTSGVYLRYLADGGDSIIEALRTVAGSPGATIVHCAAGKDRTGVVVAFALAEVGVTREAIVEDYARSAERIVQIFGRLTSSSTYAADLEQSEAKAHSPQAGTMDRLFDAMDEFHGGIPAWLRSRGWTDEDAAALRAKLLD